MDPELVEYLDNETGVIWVFATEFNYRNRHAEVIDEDMDEIELYRKVEDFIAQTLGCGPWKLIVACPMLDQRTYEQYEGLLEDDLEVEVRYFDDAVTMQLNDPEVLRPTLKARLLYHLKAARNIAAM